MTAALDHYDVLMIPRDADAVEIRAAFRSLIARWHPDRSAAADAHARSAAIIEAYRTLSAPDRRRAYDRRRSAASVPPGPERRRGERRRGAGIAPDRGRGRKARRALSLIWAISALAITIAAAEPLIQPAEEIPADLIREAVA